MGKTELGEANVAIRAGTDKLDGDLGDVRSRITQGLAAVGAAGAAVLGAGVAAGKVLFNLAEGAAPLEGIRASFQGITGDAEGMLASLREGTMGMVTDAELMRNYNQAAQLVGKTFADQLPDAMGYLGKVAAATGTDVGFMLDSLTKGVGRLSPMILDNLGIQVTLADATARASEMFGVEEAALTKAQVQAGMMEVTLAALAENTAAMPDVAENAATKMAQLETTMANLKAELGTAVLPILTQMAGMLGGLAKEYGPQITAMFGRMAETLGPLLGNAMGMLIPALISLLNTLMPVAETLWNTLFPALSAVLEAVLPLAAALIAQLAPVFQAVLEAILPVAVTLIEMLAPIIMEIVGRLLPVFVPLITMLADVFMQLLVAILPLIETLLAGLMPVFMQIIEAIMPLVEVLLGALMPVFLQIAEAVLPPLIAVIVMLAGMFGELIEAIMPLVEMLLAELVPVFLEIVEMIMPPLIAVIMVLAGVFMRLMMAIMPLVETLLAELIPVFLEIIEAILPPLIDVLMTLLDVFVEFIDAILPVFTELLEIILPIVSSLAVLIAEGLGVALEALAGLIETVVQPIMDWWIRTILEPIIDILDRISIGIQSVTEWFKGLTQTIRDMNLPGWMTPGSPTPLELGLRGIGDELQRVDGLMGGLNATMTMQAVPAAAGATSMWTGNIVINGAGDPQATAGAVIRALQDRGILAGTMLR